MAQKSLFLQAVQYKARAKRLSPRTERAYVSGIRRFIRHHGLRHPKDLGETEVAVFLNYLAAERRVAPSTQTQALCALLFLYDRVLERPLGRLQELSWARPRGRLPVVLTREEVEAVLRQLEGVPWLVAMLLYGSGLRLLECLQLRVKDVDLARGEIRVRDTKGRRPPVTVLPEAVQEPLRVHVARDDCRAKVWLDPVQLHDSTGFGRAELGTVQALVGEHGDELRKAWDDFFAR